jgi:hypothetical protein
MIAVRRLRCRVRRRAQRKPAPRPDSNAVRAAVAGVKVAAAVKAERKAVAAVKTVAVVAPAADAHHPAADAAGQVRIQARHKAVHRVRVAHVSAIARLFFETLCGFRRAFWMALRFSFAKRSRGM